MSQTAFQFDWESAVPVDEQSPESAPMQPAAEPAAMEFDWQTATPVEEFDAASARPLADHEVKAIEEENYRRVDYVMTPEEFTSYRQRRKAEDNEVGRFIDGIAQGAAGMVGMVPEAGRELRDAMVGMVTDPVNQVQRNVQTGAEAVRKAGINLVQLYDWVSNKVDDLSTSSKRAEVINAGIRQRLQDEGKLTGDRSRDEQIYQAALAEARASGAYDPTPIQQEEDDQKAYERYLREKSLEQEFAKVTDFQMGQSQVTAPAMTADAYQVTDEKPMETLSTIGAMAIDPVNLVPLGAGALSKVRVLRRMAKLSEAPLKGIQRGAEGLADVAERIEFGITSRVQDITGLTPKQQAVGGAAAAGAAIYADQVGGGNNLTKAVTLVGGILPALRYGGGFIRKVGGAAGGAATVVREAGVGGLGAARAEAAAGLADNAAIPERYRRHFRGYVEGTDSTLKRVAQDADNPEMLRRLARLGDRAGVTQAARLADDAVSGAVTAGMVGTPFAALQPDAERAGEVMGGIMALGGLGGIAGGMARRRSPDVVDADIARMFADVQAVGGNVDAFARLPHQSLDKLASMQGVLAGKVDFIPLTGDEYRMNADIAQNAGETTAGLFIDKDSSNRARVFINMDAKRGTETIAPHEIGHAILTSNILDGQPRNDLRNLVNQQYGQDGVAARGREYVARLIDNDIKANATGEAVADAATRERLVNERFEELSQRSIEKGQDPLDWARDEIIAETFASDAPAIDFRAIRRDAMFPRLAESMLSAGGRVLEMFGANLSSTGRLLDNPSVLFRDNPLFQDRIMQKRVREYIRSYDQFLAGLEEAGSAAPKGVELARSNNPADLGRSTHVKLRDEGRGVLENDFLFQKPDGTYSFKPQKLINQTEASRAAQIKTLYDARKFVPVNSTEFGKRKVNGRETIGGPVLPPQFDLFTHFPQHLRPNKQTGDLGLVRSFEASREDGGTYYVDYNRIGSGASGRYRVLNFGNVRAIQTEMGHLGWLISKANHLLAVIMDINAFRASAMKAINRGELGIFNNDMRQVEADLKTYLLNHKSGLPGEAGIGQAKRDMLNGLIGTGTAVQREANPIYAPLNPRGSIRTFRVDRINDAQPTGRTGYFFDYDKINNNRMPQALPREAMGMPDGGPVMETYLDREYNPNVLAEQAEREGYQLVYHGDRNQPDNSKYKPWKRAKMPLFTALEPEGADWYGDPRPLFVKSSKVASYDDMIAAARKAGIKGQYGDRSGDVSIPEVKKHSQYDGANENDLLYIPRVREELRRQGFDAVRVWDQLERDEIEALIVIGSPDQIVDPLARLATGRARGQAMPDVGSFDESVGGFVVDAGDDVSLPVHQQAVRGKPALDATGKPKYIQLGYDLLDAPGIKEYAGPGPEDITKPDYKALAYDTTLKGQKQINDAIDSGAVDNAANRIVSLTQEAMKNPEIAAGMGWYSRMRKYLLDALGEEGRELLSQLLGATSAKTPVEQNFLQAMDALEGIRAGRYEGNRKSYLEMLAAEEGNNLTALIVERGYVSQVRKMADDLSKLSRSLKGEKKKAALAEASKLRTLAKTPASKWTKKDRFSIMINATGMVPLRSNGKKFNANSMAVLKVVAGTWLDNRNSPKTPNFAGNLSGRTVQATIDVWAARLLRETLHEGSNRPWRIQPRSETGVNNQDFALGQVIMQRAAKKLDMNPDDLQAVLWFAEKHRWDGRGWTKNQGAEKSSFDEVFKVFFPKGKKPLTFAEASKIFEEKE